MYQSITCASKTAKSSMKSIPSSTHTVAKQTTKRSSVSFLIQNSPILLTCSKRRVVIYHLLKKLLLNFFAPNQIIKTAMLKCQYCKNDCRKKGFQTTGKQKFQCRICKKYQQENYQKRAWKASTDRKIIALTKESCGIRSIARLLKIACNTVLKRTLIPKPRYCIHAKTLAYRSKQNI